MLSSSSRRFGRWHSLGVAWLAALSGWNPAAAAVTAPAFEREVAPLLQARCLRCHSGGQPKGALDLTSRAGLLRGGQSGVVVVPGKAAESVLIEYVRDRKMPPKDPLAEKEVDLLRRWIDAGAAWTGPALKPPASSLRRAGPDWWSLQPVRRPAVPAVFSPAWVRTPIDAFILARLDAAGLKPAHEADRRTFIQRVTVDLTGLRPTPAEIDAFLADRSADSYEKLVDRLLASPHYGERWGRHWLDVVRFGESAGYEVNPPRLTAWPYRDYVIRAFNRDISYPQFIREQLAGEDDPDPLTASATGFLVAGPHDVVGNATVEGSLQQRHDDLADMVGTTAATFLGLTVNCARCHDHKFDPILQKDFYGLEAVFAGVMHAERPMPSLDATVELAQARGELDRLRRELDTREPLAGPPGTAATRLPVQIARNVERFAPVEALHVRFTITATLDGSQPCIDELEVYGPNDPGRNLALASSGSKATASSLLPGYPIHQIAHINDGQHGNSHSWISQEPGKGWVQVTLARPAKIDRVVWGRDRLLQFHDRLARDYRVETSLDGRAWTAVAGSWDRAPAAAAPDGELNKLLDRRAALEKRIAELSRPRTVYAGTFQSAGPTYLLKRGDPMQKQARVGPSAVRSVSKPLEISVDAPESQRRKALAAWLADAENPLPARVMVNRMWHWHFGTGIVRTPSDFGFNGDRPSHPELLDWLADEFRAGGGRLKPVHRLIVLSSTYRQSGAMNFEAMKIDAGNRLLWRRTPRRLEAEVLRDTMLQVSGALDLRAGGPGYELWEMPSSGQITVYKAKEALGPDVLRRMVYQFKPRLQQDRTFGAFDCPDATATAPRRNISTTPLQALNLLNDPFVRDQAARFAGRVQDEAGPAAADQVRHAFRLAFGREPSAREQAASIAVVEAHGLTVLSQTLFNTNEFAFID
jgi:hypothetical protein